MRKGPLVVAREQPDPVQEPARALGGVRVAHRVGQHRWNEESVGQAERVGGEPRRAGSETLQPPVQDLQAQVRPGDLPPLGQELLGEIRAPGRQGPDRIRRRPKQDRELLVRVLLEHGPGHDRRTAVGGRMGGRNAAAEPCPPGDVLGEEGDAQRRLGHVGTTSHRCPRFEGRAGRGV